MADGGQPGLVTNVREAVEAGGGGGVVGRGQSGLAVPEAGAGTVL